MVDNDQSLIWDSEGHVESSTQDGKTTRFVYSPEGERLVRKDPDATTLYLPGMELRLDKGSGKVEATRYHQVTDVATIVVTAAGTQIQVADHNGTGQAGIDGRTGGLVYRRSTPFGVPRGAQPSDEAWRGDRGFVGGIADAVSGLTLLGAREYDPVFG